MPQDRLTRPSSLVGWDINAKLFVEAAYNYSPEIDGIHADTFTLSLGLCF